jgi:predicted DNA-binding protein
MNAKPEKQIQYGIRLLESVLDRSDKIAEHMSRPGIMQVTRADVIRLAVSKGLEQIESEVTPKKNNEKRKRDAQ